MVAHSAATAPAVVECKSDWLGELPSIFDEMMRPTPLLFATTASKPSATASATEFLQDPPMVDLDPSPSSSLSSPPGDPFFGTLITAHDDAGSAAVAATSSSASLVSSVHPADVAAILFAELIGPSNGAALDDAAETFGVGHPAGVGIRQTELAVDIFEDLAPSEPAPIGDDDDDDEFLALATSRGL